MRLRTGYPSLTDHCLSQKVYNYLEMNNLELDNNFFIGIRDPLSVRKEILKCSKDLLIILKKYEYSRELREKKIEIFSMLKKKAREISFLNNKLKKMLPTKGIRALASYEKKLTSNKQNEEPSEISRKPRRLTELEKLEYEINSVERKLNSLE